MKSSKRQELDELFHQPARLEIMAELCSSAEWRTFIDLQEKCELTDGNLSRHLQALTLAGAIKIKKSFVKAKPRTTVSVTPKGRERFLEYLNTLEEVLHDATKRATGKSNAHPAAFRVLKPSNS